MNYYSNLNGEQVGNVVISFHFKFVEITFLFCSKYLTPFECRKWPERILTVSGLWEHEDIDKKKQLLLKVYINVVGIYLNVGMLLEVLAIFLIGGGYKVSLNGRSFNSFDVLRFFSSNFTGTS